MVVDKSAHLIILLKAWGEAEIGAIRFRMYLSVNEVYSMSAAARAAAALTDDNDVGMFSCLCKSDHWLASGRPPAPAEPRERARHATTPIYII